MSLDSLLAATQQQNTDELMFWIGFFFVWLFVAAVCAGIGQAIGAQKGRSRDGMILGLLLNVLGVIIIAIMEPTPQARAQRTIETQRAMRTMAGTPAGWYPDPYGAHQLRWFDGSSWREIVADNGVESIDAPPTP